MRISVVIATYNRAELLRKCLQQLERQSYLPGDEIVVANNGSTDATPRVVEEASGRMPAAVRLVTETQPGKSIAIATALDRSSGEILAFTDDDVVVADDWVTSLRHAMVSSPVALVGGPVLPLYDCRVPDWLDLGDAVGFNRMAAPLGLLHYGDVPEPLGSRVLLGANMAVRRDAFVAVGGFPSHLGKLRGTLLSGEDHQLCERVQSAGYLAVYDPRMRVRHLVPAERLTPTYFLRWFFWSGMTHATMDRQRATESRRFLGAPGYVVRELAEASARTAGAVLRASWNTGAREATHAAFAAGYLWATWTGRPSAGMRSRRRPVEAA